MSGPRIELDCDQLSRLTGWGDGDGTGDPVAFAINAISSLGRKLAIFANVLHEADGVENVAGAMACERERCEEIVKVLRLLVSARRDEPEATPPAAPSGGADSMLSDVHSYLSDARDVAGSIVQSQMGRESTVAHEDLVKLMGALHGAEQALDFVIDAREAAHG